MTVSLKMQPARGFTLLELIVAAGILALIAVFSWRGLDALVREREAIAASQATIDVMQRSFARVERDALLASDVQLDAQSMKLLAGTSSIDGATGSNVEYRLAGGALTRVVAGVDRAPLTMIDGVTSLVMETWAPTPRGGSWVRVKGDPTDGPVVVGAPNNGGPAVYGVSPMQAPQDPGPGTPAAASQQPGAAGATSAPAAPQNAAPPSNAATGIRMTIALADGSTVVRTFIVGGG